MFGREQDRLGPWMIAAAAVAGATVISYAVLRLVRRKRRRLPRRSALDFLEEAAVTALRHDAVTGACAIDVAAITPGIIELTGTVPTHETGQRAARLLHALPGVRTVINRLDTRSLEHHLAENRSLRARGEPWTRERHWYGVRVGTGRRRQSRDTDPDRADDTVARRTRELEVSERDIGEATSPEPPGQGTDTTP